MMVSLSMFVTLILVSALYVLHHNRHSLHITESTGASRQEPPLPDQEPIELPQEIESPEAKLARQAARRSRMLRVSFSLDSLGLGSSSRSSLSSVTGSPRSLAMLAPSIYRTFRGEVGGRKKEQLSRKRSSTRFLSSSLPAEVDPNVWDQATE
ncbi:hypothetical protein ElyMa_003045500 [Elysia marginata]|uniref:Uncharacterized protein n=1 Tax=Elysia marginata TaxID=1093978 RepID=A0AAV4IKF1_9GAST|nr:hypothetical protein ElyMa_003045500 [Elysia marginata]